VVSTFLVFGHATNNTADSPQVQLAAATIGIGGRGDPAAARIPDKLQGKVLPTGFKYIPVNYPASFFIDSSGAAGVPVLNKAIKDNAVQSCAGTTGPCPPSLLVVGYSEGTIVAEKVRRGLTPGVAGAPLADDLRFVMIASPNVPNGGIFARFPDVSIPFFVTSNGAAQPSPYGTTYVTNEYDPYADFPAYFNPLSLLNTLAAIAYVHPDQYYDTVDYNPQTGEHGPGVLVKDVTHTVDGHEVTDHYVFVPAAHLPLLAPVRQLATALGLTPFTEPLLNAIEPTLRKIVDMGYTDRENLNPEVPVKFSLITPPEKIAGTLAKLPDGSTPGPIVSKIAPTNSPSINAKSLPQEPQESLLNNDPQESLLKNDPPAAGATDPAPPQTPSGSSGTPPKTPPVSPLTKTGTTNGKVTEDGNMFTPKSTKTTAPKKNLLTQLTDTLTGFFSPKKPESSTPTTGPDNSAPTGPTPQSQGQPNDAAA
jgi:hypothetical protein